jgi:NADPH-dependent 2,4-dienoyl-CoA reductase/sulfur reductase-like enzyme
VWPQKSGALLNDGRALPYDYLVIATGPKPAFDEIRRLPARIRVPAAHAVDGGSLLDGECFGDPGALSIPSLKKAGLIANLDLWAHSKAADLLV